MSIFWSRATNHREPCQVLTEAALSGGIGVPRGNLRGVTCLRMLVEKYRETGARHFLEGSMTNEPYSVFDIIGPRMIGPSSSHTAGAVRIAHIARHIAHYDVAEAAFTLYESFAETGRGHGTDKALVGGILGMEPDDRRIRDAYEIAREQGVMISMEFSDEPSPVERPNTVKIRVTSSDGRSNEIIGVSIGGGKVVVMAINGLEVEVSGEYPTIVVRHTEKPGVIAEISTVLAELGINIAYMKVFRHEKGEDAFMTIETDEKISDETLQKIREMCPSILNVIVT